MIGSAEERTLEAVKVYLARQSRVEHPYGEFDNARRWYPNLQEQQTCCNMVRSPSRSFPYSLLTHCRSSVHIANLFGVEVKLLRKAINADIGVCSSKGFKKRCEKCHNRFVCFTSRVII